MKTYEIEDGIPLPKLVHRYPLDALEVGQSFFAEEDPESPGLFKAIRAACTNYTKRKDSTKRFTTRLRIKDGKRGLRVWRES